MGELSRKDDLDVMYSRKKIIKEVVIVDTHNNEIEFEIIKTPIITENDIVIGTVGIARDITDRKVRHNGQDKRNIRGGR